MSINAKASTLENTLKNKKSLWRENRSEEKKHLWNKMKHTKTTEFQIIEMTFKPHWRKTIMICRITFQNWSHRIASHFISDSHKSFHGIYKRLFLLPYIQVLTDELQISEQGWGLRWTHTRRQAGRRTPGWHQQFLKIRGSTCHSSVF